MRRRKLLISIGALGAGGTAAFGTEAFTSVEAERSVDVEIAGDQSAFISIQPLESDNAEEYVGTESDKTVELNLDGDNTGPGDGVNQDAITQVEDLFKIVNQGSQAASVFFEDESDAVTFRVTRSTNTSTQGSNGQTLEGADSSVELSVGEQVVVGLTINTLKNDVSGQLLDSVTLRADASASAPEQSIPEPQYVVDGSGDEPNTFPDLSTAITSDDIGSGAVVGIDGSVSITEDSTIDISTNDITVTGFNGQPTIDRDVQNGPFIEASGNGVTIQNLEITEDVTDGGFGGEESLLVSGTGVTIDAVRVKNQDNESPKGNPAIKTTGKDTTITNCESINTPISANGASGSLTLTNNFIEDALAEGIFSFSSEDGEIDFTVENNEVKNHDINDVNAKEIKIVDDPASVNGETNKSAQIESLLTENSVNSVQVSDDVGTQATPDIVGSGEQFASINDVLSPGVKDGSQGSTDTLVALFEEGEYGSASNEIFNSKITHNKDNAIIRGLSKPTITYTGMDGNNNSTPDVKIAGDNTTVQDLDLVFTNVGTTGVGGESFLDFSGADGTLQSVDITYDPRSNAGGPTGYVSVSGSGTITFEGCTFSNTDSANRNRFVSAGNPNNPGVYESGGKFELLDCEFNDGTKVDINVPGDAEAVYKNNQFNAKPEFSPEVIQGTPSGGTITVEGNVFNYSNGGQEKIKLNGYTSSNVNDIESASKKEAANAISKDNGTSGEKDVEVLVGSSTRVGGDER